MNKALFMAITVAACALTASSCTDMPEPRTLGPADGHDLPPTDLDRVSVGSLAPDFTLASYAGEPVTLSDYRGREVLLVFYRGHW